MNKFKPELLSTIEFLQFIRQRPGMYFGDKVTLTGLQNFLFGFMMNSKRKSTPPFEYFNSWVNKRLNNSGSALGWISPILENCKNDELKAFWKFYELLDEFILIKPLEIYEANLNIENFNSYYSTEKGRPHRYLNIELNKTIIIPAPYHIKLIEFNYSVYAYFYDYRYIIGETEMGKMDIRDYDTIDYCKKQFNEMFGELEWDKIAENRITKKFKTVVKNS